MDKRFILKKGPVVALLSIFFMISATCSAGIIRTELRDIFEETENEIDTLILNVPGYFLYGTLGENGWYKSCVTLTFNWNPNLCKEVWININGGGWQKYTSTIEICSDGRNTIAWYWIDIDDQKNYESPFQIKIDKTPPTINLQKKVITDTEIIFTAKVTDPASGVMKVEFFVDDSWEAEDNSTPYEYTWEGDTEQIIKATAYDYAGFSASDTANTKPRTRDYLFKGIFLSKPLQFLLDILISGQIFIFKLKT